MKIIANIITTTDKLYQYDIAVTKKTDREIVMQDYENLKSNLQELAKKAMSERSHHCITIGDHVLNIDCIYDIWFELIDK